MNQALPKRAQFHHMKDGTREDWEIIGAEFFEFRAQYVADQGTSSAPKG